MGRSSPSAIPAAISSSTPDADLKKPVPVLTDAAFLTYKTKGTRPEYESPLKERRNRLLDMTIAECLTNQGKYLPGIERELDAILSEKNVDAAGPRYRPLQL